MLWQKEICLKFGIDKQFEQIDVILQIKILNDESNKNGELLPLVEAGASWESRECPKFCVTNR